MITLTQKIILHKLDETTEVSFITHIYSETGYFTDSKAHKCGWHIQLGTTDTASNYTEVPGSEQHAVPASLPDIDAYEEDEDAEAADYEAALTKLGVDVS